MLISGTIIIIIVVVAVVILNEIHCDKQSL